jgi:hypothetical protein
VQRFFLQLYHLLQVLQSFAKSDYKKFRGKRLKLTPVQRHDIQVFKGNKVELTFEKSIGFQQRKNKKIAQHRIKMNKDGKVFVANDLSEELYDMFLSKITIGEIVETIEDLIILFSDPH